MSVFLMVNGRDLSAYVNVQPDDGLDPVNAERIAPQFSGALALREGQGFVTTTTGNREWTIPMVIDAGSRADLHALIQAINNDLTAGAEVRFATDPNVDSVTYFTLEAGRLDPSYNYFHSVHATTRATLKLWTRPHGSTGTMRTVASFQSTGPIDFPATGIIGDVSALARLEVRVGSAVASSGRLVAFGIHPNASYLGVHPAASFADKPASALATGASGAIGSMYLAVPGGATGASGYLGRDYLVPAAGYVGRSRVWAFLRSNVAGVAFPVYAVDRWGAPLGATVVASQTDPAKWQVADLGVVNVVARASGQEPVATQFVELRGGGASGGSYGQASGYGLAIAALVYQPLDYAPGLVRTRGAANTLYAGDTFAQPAGTLHFIADLGGNWKKLGGFLGWNDLTDRIGIVSPVVASGKVVDHATGATGFYSLASGVQYSDVNAELIFSLAASGGGAPSAFASGANLVLWAKGNPQNASLFQNGVRAEFAFIPTPMLTLWRGPSTVGATAAAMSLASGVLSGQLHTLALQIAGPTARVWVGTAGAQGAAAITDNSVNYGIVGNPALQMREGGGGGWPYADLVRFLQAASAPDITPREWFRFSAHPESRAFQGNASVFTADRAADFRGAPPRLPPVGSPAPSGPARVVAFAGEVDNFVGNDGIDVRLDVLDRFTFLR